MISTQVVTVTPKLASEFLCMNKANRPLSKNIVATYASAMIRG